MADKHESDPLSYSESGIDVDGVTINLSFAVGIQKPEKDPHFYETFRDGHRKRIYEGIQHTHHFHMHYQVLPDQEDQVPKVFKTDMVVYGGVVSKVYTEQDTRVVQGWPESADKDQGAPQNQITKFCWRHRHKFKVDRSLLIDFHHHMLEVHIWTATSKLAPRARYDAPKAFRLPSLSDEDLANPGSMERERQPFMFPEVSHEQRLRNSKGRNTRILHQHQSWGVPVELSLQSVNTDATGSSDKEEQVNEPKKKHVEKREVSCESKKTKHTINSKYSSNHPSSGRKLDHPSSPRNPKSNPFVHQQIAIDTAEKLRIDEDGLVVLRLKMSDLFSKHGCTHESVDFTEGHLRAFEVHAFTTAPMPVGVTRDLKPLTLTIEKVTHLPTTPHSHQELRDRCEPVSVKYQFPTQSPFTTPSLPHQRNLFFNSPNVMLMGTANQALLLEHLRGPPLVIEVHDRDIPDEQELSEHALFGTESQDDLIGTHAFSSLPHLVSYKGGKKQSLYGVASVDLSVLLTEQLLIEMTIPVIKGPRNSADSAKLGLSPGGLSSHGPHIYPGDYLESECELTVKMELVHPLMIASSTGAGGAVAMFKEKSPKSSSPWKKRPPKKSLPVIDSQLSLVSCPFSRIVYSISSNGKALIGRLLAKIDEINAKTLELGELSPEMRKAALSTYKLTEEQIMSKQCNLITGFHMEDQHHHILMLEGLREGGVKTLWEELPRHTTQHPDIIKVFYNSEFGFSQRLYGLLDVDIPRITLSHPIKEIVKDFRVYVKGHIPMEIFRSLMCLNELELAKEMADLTRNNLFPSAREVSMLGFMFPRAVVEAEQGEGTGEEGEESQLSPIPEYYSHLPRPMAPKLEPRTKKVCLYLDANNPEYEEMLRERRNQGERENFIQSNIAYCEVLSELSRFRKPSHGTHFRSRSEDTSLPVYNYSSQAKNSVQCGMARIKREMEPKKRYTFCQDYLFGAFDPDDRGEAKTQYDRFQADDGKGKVKFVYPGGTTALESNAHPKKPTSYRLEEISKPFADPVPEGDTRRQISNADRLRLGVTDFDLRKAPSPEKFGPFYETVHPFGDEWEYEQAAMLRLEKRKWREKVVVDDVHFHTHRRNVATELSGKAGNRLDSLKGMLKDNPKKLSLKNNDKLCHLEMSPLSIIQNPSIDPSLNRLTVGGEEGGVDRHRGYQPGPHNNRSLRSLCNAIPRTDNPKHSRSNTLPIHSQPFRLHYQPHKSICHYPNKPRPSEAQDTLPPPLYMNRMQRLSVMSESTQRHHQNQQHLEQAPA